MRQRLKYTFVRFILVGGLNTFLDFFLLNALIFVGSSFIVSKLIASTSATLFSFFANKYFVFRSSSRNKIKDEFFKFVVVNIVGILLLQNLLVFWLSGIMLFFSGWISEIAVVNFKIDISSEVIAVNLANVFAIVLSLIWNYFFYRTVVFASRKEPILSPTYPSERYGHRFTEGQPLLSILIPAYREERRLPETLETLKKYLNHNKYEKNIEIVLSIANSEDRTYDIARKYSTKFYSFVIVRPGDPIGKGRDVGAGLLESRGRFRLFMDADLATPLHHIDTILEKIQHKKNSKQIFIGVRNISKSHEGVRRLISLFGNLLVKTILLLKVSDTQCGFKAFPASYIKEMRKYQHIAGWGFDMELLTIARIKKFRVSKILIDDWVDKEFGTFESNAIAGALATLKDLILIRLNLWAGKYRTDKDI